MGFRLLTALFFIAAGANHFWHAGFYVRITPPFLPCRVALVQISGFFEMLGGAGLMLRPLPRFAGWALILLLLLVFPANLYMAIHPDRFSDLHLPPWTFWLRLPMQGLLIAWVYWVAISETKANKDKS